MTIAIDGATAAEILDTIARYAQVIDNRDWDRADTVFTPDFVLGPADPDGPRGVAALRRGIESIHPYHPHHTTDTALHAVDVDTVRAWSKYFIVRTDGSIASGDYQDTIRRTPSGWRIAARMVSRGNRPADDPGGPSARELGFDSWQDPHTTSRSPTG